MLIPGTLLEMKRRESDMTQEEVAKHLGISRNTLAAYESGKTDIPVTVFIRLSELYNCDVCDIFGVHADNIVFDVSEVELVKAHADYCTKREMYVDKKLGIKRPDGYYEIIYKNYFNKKMKQLNLA